MQVMFTICLQKVEANEIWEKRNRKLEKEVIQGLVMMDLQLIQQDR